MKKRQKTKHNDANYEKRIKGIFLAKVRKNKKKFLAGLLAVAIASSGHTITHAQTNSETTETTETTYEEEYEVKEVKAVVEKVQLFNDVSKNHWAYESIAKLQGAGVIEESLSGNFHPNQVLTRQVFTIYLMKALGIKSDKVVGSYMEKAYGPDGHPYLDYKLNKFYDIWKYSEAHPYIAAAYYNGIISGVSDTHFDPEGLITREQAAIIMSRIFKKYYEGQIYTAETNFTDSNQISSWAKEAVDMVATMGIFNGMPDGSFNPKGSITKAESMTIIAKIAEQIKGIKFGIPSIDHQFKTVDERLAQAGAKYSDWYFGNGFMREDIELSLDETTLREREMGGQHGLGGYSATIAKPLKGDEEWSVWITYKLENEKESSLRLFDNGSIEELTAEGIIKSEYKEIIAYKGTAIEKTKLMVRIKANYESIPLWRNYTYEQRDILNLSTVLDNDPSLLEDISYLQPLKNSYTGELEQVERIPEPYKLKLTND